MWVMDGNQTLAAGLLALSERGAGVPLRELALVGLTAAIITYLSLRLRPTPSQNRSSGSWYTFSAGRPEASRCRQTVSGRHASSTVV